MKFLPGALVAGFRLREARELTDISAVGYLFDHEKTGARLFYVDTTDDNKVFFAAFRTPPPDSTGVAHILEHSVLCGSWKYPVRDPFNELAKGSLHTYLNALTYPDKTVYPVASRNEKDFRNLMDVYLDAVFFSRIYRQKEIFLQEGWRLEKKDGALTYNGVVYNEMKGALSDPERLLMDEINRSLFPSSIYRFESGGDPAEIPQLTYEAFLAFHQKFYHPSNCCLYLYGDMDVEACLQTLNEDYLSHFDRICVPSQILPETRLTAPVEQSGGYPAAEGGCYLSYNVLAGSCTDPVRVLALSVLGYLLLETNASPLKTALRDAGIGDDAENWFDSSGLDMVFSVVVKNASPDQRATFERTVRETCETLDHTGFDPQMIEAALSMVEFQMRERDYGYRPKGLVYGLKMLKRMLHDQTPFAALEDGEILAAVRATDFGALLKEVLLKNPRRSLVTLSPDPTLAARQRSAMEQDLRDRQAAMTPAQSQALAAETAAFRKWQTEPESPADLAKIPCLKLSDVGRKADFLSVETARQNLFARVPSNGILYLKLLFPTFGVPADRVPEIGLLKELLTNLGTEKYSRDALATAMDLTFGDLSVHSEAFPTPGGFLPALTVDCRFLREKKAEAFALLEEILCRTDFSAEKDMERTRKEALLRLSLDLPEEGHLTAVRRCLAHFSGGDAWKELTQGAAFLETLDCPAEPEKMGQISRLILHKGFLAHVAGEEDTCETELSRLRAALPEEPGKKAVFLLPGFPQKEALTTDGKVLYVAQAADFRQDGFVYSGTMKVAESLVDRAWLWDRVRVQGGAYGCGVRFRRDGKLYFYSYRDPGLSATLSVYRETAGFLENLALSQGDLTRYVLGAINAMDRPKTNAEAADLALRRYLAGVSEADAQAERQQVLETTVKDLRALAPLLTAAVAQGQVCVVGDPEKIRVEKEMFDKVRRLM